ncbi:uncharacterized protein LOC109721845 [Ananas comosus]|uniref:Uncharacterized protein LOC109721845 n=1 Tax=Ananas comosus TaxID=4615 RepID=A0A6P5GGW6_ANACO|nr:uncharacterized protein LOC109721845 [Ananas comosus]XP_020105244.1 uncharacterized protein LOC109721845 [Ananas comosus]
MARDWTDLSSGVLAAIAARLTAIDYMAFRKVCRLWARSVSGVPPSPHVPYLLLLGGGGGDDDDGERSDEFTFLGLPGQTLHRLPVPGLRGKYCVGSQHGWLATLDPFSEPALLNPLTGQEIPLPSITTLPDIHPSYAPDGSVASYFHFSDPTDYYFHYKPEEFRGLSFDKVAFSSSPAAGGPLTVVALYGIASKLAFTTAGADRWRLHDDGWRFHDVAFRRGSLLALSGDGDLLAVDLSGGYADVVRLVASQFDPLVAGQYRRYLVADDATGDLLQVWRNFDFDDVANTLTTREIKVMRLDWGTNRWIPISSLGGRALFLGIGSSMLLSPEDVRGLRPNCVYLTDDWWDMLYSEEVRLARRDVGIYCLEDASLQPCHSPDPRFNWPPPVWISPSLS